MSGYKESFLKEHPIVFELYLVRHGNSRGNAGTQIDTLEGRENPELTELGIHQAELLGERFSDFPLDCVISSGLERAVRTAEEVVKRQPENGASRVEINPVFTEERLNSEYKGKSFSDIKKEHPCAVIAEGAEKYELTVCHTQTDEESLKRAEEAVEYLKNRFKNGERVMVVAHAAFLTDLFLKICKIADEPKYDPSFFNTGVTKFIFYEEGKGLYNKDAGLVYLNECSHFDDELKFMYYYGY